MKRKHIFVYDLPVFNEMGLPESQPSIMDARYFAMEIDGLNTNDLNVTESLFLNFLMKNQEKYDVVFLISKRGVINVDITGLSKNITKINFFILLPVFLIFLTQNIYFLYAIIHGIYTFYSTALTVLIYFILFLGLCSIGELRSFRNNSFRRWYSTLLYILTLAIWLQFLLD